MSVLLSGSPATAAKAAHIHFILNGGTITAPNQVFFNSVRPQLSSNSRVSIWAMVETETQMSKSHLSAGCKQALVSLSNRHDLAFLGNGLQALGYTINSTGGTATALEDAGVSVTRVEEITHFPETLDGRVKSLHPSIHGGLFARRVQDQYMGSFR